MPPFPEHLLASQQCNKSPGMLLCPTGVVEMFKKCKIRCVDYSGRSENRVAVLDSELFSCRYTQTQYYTLTTPTGSCGSKNKRPNNTHLNLRGTQMSPAFLELHCILLHLPLKLCKFLCCVFILYCSQYCIACQSCDHLSPWDVEETRPRGPCEPVWKHLVVCTVPYTTCPDIPTEIVIKVHEGRQGDDSRR